MNTEKWQMLATFALLSLMVVVGYMLAQWTY
jgi:hypothetical protein